MRLIYKIKYLLTITLLTGLLGCEKNFEEINTNPNGIDPSTASPDGVMATVQIYAFGEPRFVTWRGNVIYTSQFAHHYVYNFGDMAWFPGAAYINNQGWTDAVWESSNIKVAGHLNALRSALDEEADKGEVAVVNVISAWFYQKMTDIFGDIPYSDVAKPQRDVVLKPAYDSQGDIYRALLESLGEQIEVLSNTEAIGFGGGDFIYANDPAKWVAFANTLRLRIALRGRDAFINDGDQSFVDDIINEALSTALIDVSSEAMFERAQSGLFLSDPNELMGGQEDVWHSFAFNQSQWVLNERVVNLLQDNNDPRLEVLATEADSVPGLYAGIVPNMKDPDKWGFLSKPSGLLRGETKNDPVPAYIMTAAESYFLQAEAALLGYNTSSTAEELYQNGISAHMNTYNVNSADITDFMVNEAVASLTGTSEENLQKVWAQRWLAYLNNGYEAWALVRRTNMIPKQIGDDFLNNETKGEVPSRLVYPTSEKTLNADNMTNANQGGADLMTTKLWWDID